MKMKNKSLIIMVLALSLLAFAGFSQAQQGGTLKGKVIDKNENFSLPTVKVSISGTKKFGVTNADGDFVITDIPAGTYQVVFEVSGYLTETQKNVTIGAGQTVELNISMGMGFAREMTVTARREVESLQRVPQNIEVLTTTALADSPTVNLGQVLNNVTGVDMETFSGNANWGGWIYIDGYGDEYIKKMVDGVDIGEIVANWSQINAYQNDMIDQVEVVKGGTSSVWGANMGGIINIITKRPQNMERPSFTLKGDFSKFGNMNFTGASANPNSGYLYDYSANLMGNYKKFGYMVGLTHNHSDGFVEYAAEKNTSVFAKFGYDFSDKTYLDFLYNRTTLGYQNHAFLTTDLFGPEWPYYWNYKMDMNSTTNVSSLKLSSNVAPALNLEAQLKFYRMSYSDSTDWLAGGAINSPTGEIDTSSYLEQRLGFTVKSSYNPSESFSLVSGVDYYRIKADFTHYISNQPLIYVDSVAPFVNAEYRIGNLGLHAGARYDYDSSFGSQLSPSLGANFNFLKSSLVRLNIARTFKVPPLWYTLGESYVDRILPNPNLRPERAWAYSAGFESQELRYVYVKLSVYYHHMTDGIVEIPAAQEGRLIWANVDKFVRKGYEAELGVMPGFGITAYVSTNYNKHEDTTGGAIITWIPTQTYKSGLKFKSEKMDLMINLRGRWIWWNEDPSLVALFNPHDKRWSFDLKAEKGFALAGSTHLSVFVDLFNLTNTLYWDRSDYPNARRWVQIGFELNFK
jgi:outer membrane receptor protein involved in Fe transport